MGKKLTILIFSFLFLWSLQAQDEENGRLFQGGVVLGFNTTQLDGDNFRGYDKLGMHGGIKVKYLLPNNNKMALHLEMLYSMRGSSENLIRNSTNNTQARLKLDYIEIPLLFSYKEWKIDFHAGLSFGRLIRANTNDFTFYVPEDFNKNDFSILLGATYLFNKNWGGTIRFSRSVNNAVAKEVNKDALLGHSLTFRLEYYF